jgi:hypothetical protein
MPVIGYLGGSSPDPSAANLAAFRQGLNETGYVEGQNVAIEYRWGQNEYDLLPELAADLVRRRVAVIATPGSTQGPLEHIPFGSNRRDSQGFINERIWRHRFVFLRGWDAEAIF